MAVFISVLGLILQFSFQFWITYGSFNFSFGSHIAVSISVLGPIWQFSFQFWVPYGSFHFSFGSHIAVLISVLSPICQFSFQFWVPHGSFHCSFHGPHPMHHKEGADDMRHEPFETAVASWLLPALGSPLYIGHPLGIPALESLEKYSKEGGAMSSRREVAKGGNFDWLMRLRLHRKKTKLSLPSLCKSESQGIPRLSSASCENLKRTSSHCAFSADMCLWEFQNCLELFATEYVYIFWLRLRLSKIRLSKTDHNPIFLPTIL